MFRNGLTKNTLQKRAKATLIWLPGSQETSTSTKSFTRDLAKKREAAEVAKREKLQKGECGLDIYNMRERLVTEGLVYLDSLDDLK